MQFNRQGQILYCSSALSSKIQKIKTVSQFCTLLKNPGKLTPQDICFLSSVTKTFKERSLIYKSNRQYFVKDVDEDISMFFKKSKTQLRKEQKELIPPSFSPQNPSYSQYDVDFHEGYVYSDANWDPSLARL